MNRRGFLICAALSLGAGAVVAQSDVLRAAFEAMSEQDRRFVQLELQLMELYPAQIDMRFGPMTRSGLIDASRQINARTNGDIHFALDDLSDARRFLDLMARQQFMFMYDDGYEG